MCDRGRTFTSDIVGQDYVIKVNGWVPQPGRRTYPLYMLAKLLTGVVFFTQLMIHPGVSERIPPMTQRPALSAESLFRYVFSPKKAALPVGLRRRSIKGSKDSVKARVRAYNKMSAAHQELLKRSGQRDAYLKGELSFRDVKSAVRDVAVDMGLVKPLKHRPQSNAPINVGRLTSSEETKLLVAGKILRIAREATATKKNRRVNFEGILARVHYMDETQENDVLDGSFDYSRLKQRAVDPEQMMIINGTSFNPYWYG